MVIFIFNFLFCITWNAIETALSLISTHLRATSTLPTRPVEATIDRTNTKHGKLLAVKHDFSKEDNLKFKKDISVIYGLMVYKIKC
jgi:hypothetical protein